MRLCYFGYPIDQNWSSAAKEKIQAARLALMTWEVFYYDPMGAFHNGRKYAPGPEIWVTNHRALTSAQAALFVMPAGVPTIGTPREIEIAVHMGIPVAVLTDAPSWSLQSIGNLRAFWIDDVDQAIEWLQKETAVRGETRRQALLPVQIRDEGGQLPARHYADDAGLDLYVSEDTVIESFTFADVPTGIAVEIPSTCWGLIKSRSSTLRNAGLLVHDGVIDPGWRGYLFAGVWNLNGTARTVKAGERIAQLILHTNVTAMYQPVEVLELAPSERGEAGFGSTGS